MWVSIRTLPYPIAYMLCFLFSLLITLQAIETEDNDHFVLSPKCIPLSNRSLLVLTHQQGQLGLHQHSRFQVSILVVFDAITKTSTIGAQPQPILLAP